MRIVMKFGGTSLADRKRIFRAAERAAELERQGNQVVVVVSAQGDTTDELIARAEEMTGKACPRERDALLCVGEQLSAALMAMALQELGMEAVSLTGAQAGICTDGCFGDARILRIDTQRITKELNAGRIVVAAGFQGIDAEGNLTTLGRGGSDTTAAALAAALSADRCRIYTDVDGVYDRDPRKYPDAHKYPRIGYEEMLTLARSGAQVLHDRCIEQARDAGIELEVLSSFRDTPGTIVGE